MADPRGAPPNGQAPFAPGHLIARRYRILEEAGRGGMAVVYRARDERLNRVVAVKVAATDEAARRLAREAEIAAQVDSPAVVPVYDLVGGEDGADAIVMPYFGTTLAAALRERGPLPLEAALAMARQIAEALDAAHRAGVVHGDVKPSNVFLRGDRAFLSDFGASPAGGPPEGGGTFFGTPTYLAPEQLREGRTGPASDCYALALVLYEALTGRLPFEGADAEAVAAARLHQDPVPPSRFRPDLPPQVEALILTALARDPAARHPDAGALAAAIARLGTPNPRDAEAPTVPVRPAVPPAPPEPLPARAEVPRLPPPASPWPALAAGTLAAAAGLALLEVPAARPLGVAGILTGLGLLAAVAVILLAEPPGEHAGGGAGRVVLRRRWHAAGRALAAVDWSLVTASLAGAGLTYLVVRAWLGELPAYAAWRGGPAGAGPALLAAAVALGVACGAARQPWLAEGDRRAVAWIARAATVVALTLGAAGALWPVPALAVLVAAVALASLGTVRRYAFTTALLAAAAWLPAVPPFVVPVLLALLARSLLTPAWTASVLPLAVLFVEFSGQPTGSLATMGILERGRFDPGSLAVQAPSAGWLLDQVRAARAEPWTYWTDQTRALADALQGVDIAALLWYLLVWWAVAAVGRPAASGLRGNAVRVTVAAVLSAGGHALGASLFGPGTRLVEYGPAAAAVLLGLLWLLATRRPTAQAPPARAPADLPAA
ncbi:MAG TPA: serine/threonine-protein kinase [Dehalococcoidia bacterium]